MESNLFLGQVLVDGEDDFVTIIEAGFGYLYQTEGMVLVQVGEEDFRPTIFVDLGQIDLVDIWKGLPIDRSPSDDIDIVF